MTSLSICADQFETSTSIPGNLNFLLARPVQISVTLGELVHVVSTALPSSNAPHKEKNALQLYCKFGKKNKTKQKNLYIYYGVQDSFIFCECSERRKASRVMHSSSQKTGLYRVLPWSLR